MRTRRRFRPPGLGSATTLPLLLGLRLLLASRLLLAALLLLLAAGPAARADGASPAAVSPPPSSTRESAGTTLTLRQAVEAALAHDPGVAEARALESAAGATVEAAEADRRPQAAFRASAFQHQEPVPVTPIHGFGPGQLPDFDRTVAQGELVVHYDLYDGGAATARLAGVRAEAEAAGQRLAGRRERTVAVTVAGYLRVLALDAVLDAHRRRLDALAAEEERVELLFAAGRAAELDRRRIAAAEAAAEAERVRLATALEQAERDLARLTGLPGETTRAAVLRAPVGTAPDGPRREPPNREDLLRQALSASPDVARAEAQRRAAVTAVELARSVRRPTVGVRGGWQEFAGGDGRQDGEWRAGLEVTVPLFDGGRVAARVRAAEDRLAAAGAGVQELRQAVAAELDAALADLATASARATALGEAVRQGAEVARIEALRLEHGAGTQTDFLEAQASLLATRAALAEARFAEVEARTRLARVTGTLDPRWVGEVLDPMPVLPEAAASGEAPSGALPSGAMASGAMASGALPGGAVPAGAVPSGPESPSAAPAGATSTEPSDPTDPAAPPEEP